jgi:hypothetical protein
MLLAALGSLRVQPCFIAGTAHLTAEQLQLLLVIMNALVAYTLVGTKFMRTVRYFSGGIPSFILSHQITYQATTFTHELYKFDAQDVNHSFFKWWAANGGSE